MFNLRVRVWLWEPGRSIRIYNMYRLGFQEERSTPVGIQGGIAKLLPAT